MKLSKDGKALMSLIATLRGVNCYRAHESFYLTDGIIQVGIEKISPTDKPHFNH